MKYFYYFLLAILITSVSCNNNNNDDDDDFAGYYFNYEVDGVPYSALLDVNECYLGEHRSINVEVGDSIHGIAFSKDNIDGTLSIFPALASFLYIENGELFWDNINNEFNCLIFGDSIAQGNFAFPAYDLNDSLCHLITNGEFRLRLTH